MISRVPDVAKEDSPVFAPPNPPKPLAPNDPPKELPPNEDMLIPPRPPKPLPVAVEGAGLAAKEDSLLPLAAPKGELAAGLELARPPKGDEAELEKLPKPDDLNLSSEVCGNGSALSVDLDA